MNLSPITFEFKNKMLLAQAKGDILFEDIVHHYKLLFSHPDFFVGMPAIYDFTKVKQITGNFEYFEQTVADMGNSDIINTASYVAIVVCSENTSMNSIFNAYSQMMDYTLMNVRVFHRKEEAIHWLLTNK
jgi:hypothetical protein